MRVLRVLTRPNVGGPMRQAAALWRAHEALGVGTLLVVGRCAAGEAAFDLAALGLPRVTPEQLARERGQARGVLQLDDLGRGFAPRADARALRALRAALEAFAPDVVHTHTTKAGALGRRAAWAAGVRAVAHTFHGHVLRDYFAPPAAWWLRRLERRLAARTALLFAVSPSCADELAGLGVAPRGRFTVVPPAVETAPFAAVARVQARARLGVGDERPLLAFAGRLVPIKNPLLFADALAALPDAEGHAFGDGPLRAAAAARAGGCVRWHGARADLHQVLAAFDALLLPSEREGCPLSAVEAFAAGVPVVGFDVAGVRDVLGEWGAGVLVGRRDGAAGLARAAAALLADPGRRARLAARARAGLARFAPAAVAAFLRDRYAEVLAGSGSRSTSSGGSVTGTAISDQPSTPSA
jgi:glycosyltransferase involved in cell wall biosynthesis